MFSYFRDLLATLKRIEAHLETIGKSEANIAKIAECVNESWRGSRPSISIKSWEE